MKTLWRNGCLVLALTVATNQLAYAEEGEAAQPAETPTPVVEASPPQAPAIQPAGEAAPAPVVEAPPTPPAPLVEAPLAPTDEVVSAQVVEVNPGPAAAQPATAVAEGGFFNEHPIHGYLKSRYVGRQTDGASDQDLYETLSLDLGDTEHDRVTAHVLADLAIDLDGHTDNHGNYPFDSVNDSTGSPVVAQVYDAHLDLHRIGFVDIIRAGRQSIYETPEVSFFDGLRAETKELGSHRLKLGGYAGVPVYLYQGYSSEDFTSGAYAAGHLWKGARARVDYQRIDGQNGTAEFGNTLIGVDGWQRLGRYVDLHGHYTNLDGADRDVLARGTLNQPEWDLRFQASYYQLLQAQQSAVIGVDSYYPIMKDYLPFIEVRGMVSKGIGDHVSVDAGADVRRLSNEASSTDYNHEFDRYFATLELFDLVVKGSSISLTEEKWISQGTSTDSQGVDITCPVGGQSKVSAGTAHYLYKYDYYADQERDNVQTYYMKFDHTYSRALRLSAEYTYEDDSSSTTYHELRVEALCTF